jgi:hypothetical protein
VPGEGLDLGNGGPRLEELSYKAMPHRLVLTEPSASGPRPNVIEGLKRVAPSRVRVCKEEGRRELAAAMPHGNLIGPSRKGYPSLGLALGPLVQNRPGIAPLDRAMRFIISRSPTWGAQSSLGRRPVSMPNSKMPLWASGIVWRSSPWPR